MLTLRSVTSAFVYTLFPLLVLLFIWRAGIFYLVSKSHIFDSSDFLNILIFIIYFVVTFYIANILIQKINPIQKSTLTDHFVQSFFQYAIFIIAGLFFLQNYQSAGSYSRCIEDGRCDNFIFWGFFIAMALIGIIINGFFLFHKSRQIKRLV